MVYDMLLNSPKFYSCFALKQFERTLHSSFSLCLMLQPNSNPLVGMNEFNVDQLARRSARVRKQYFHYNFGFDFNY